MFGRRTPKPVVRQAAPSAPAGRNCCVRTVPQQPRPAQQTARPVQRPNPFVKR